MRWLERVRACAFAWWSNPPAAPAGPRRRTQPRSHAARTCTNLSSSSHAHAHAHVADAHGFTYSIGRQHACRPVVKRCCHAYTCAAPHALLLIHDPHTCVCIYIYIYIYTVAAARACARGTSSLVRCCAVCARGATI